MKPRGETAVMARRVEAPDSLDYFATPPWATRALFAEVIGSGWVEATAWDPACGQGHMSSVLGEVFKAGVYATDIFPYRAVDGSGDPPHWYRELDFLSDEARQWQILSGAADWIITNPPFKVACDFTLRALEWANVGVAMLARTSWIESKDRYERLFRDRPPTIFAPFVERVPMVKGCWDPAASTATSYSWFVWNKLDHDRQMMLRLIPPGRRAWLTRPGDYERFARPVSTPLLETPA